MSDLARHQINFSKTSHENHVKAVIVRKKANERSTAENCSHGRIRRGCSPVEEEKKKATNASCGGSKTSHNQSELGLAANRLKHLLYPNWRQCSARHCDMGLTQSDRMVLDSRRTTASNRPAANN